MNHDICIYSKKIHVKTALLKSGPNLTKTFSPKVTLGESLPKNNTLADVHGVRNVLMASYVLDLWVSNRGSLSTIDHKHRKNIGDRR